MKKRFLKVIIVFIILLAITALVLAITGVFRGSESDGYRNATGELSGTSTPMPTDAESPTGLPSPSISATPQSIETTPADSPSPIPEVIPTPGVTQKPEVSPSSTPKPTPTSTPTPTPTATPTASPTPTVSPTPEADDNTPDAEWLDKKIQKYIDEIDPQDLEDFQTIVAKLDQAYIQNLAIDGFSSEELDLMKAHLRSRLSDAEYERAKELFFTYNYLLEEV